MTWTDVFRLSTTIILSIGSGGAIVMAMGGWLGKVWASRILERERAGYAQELEERKVALGRLAAENQVRYTRLHERRAEVISEVYAKLEDLHEAVRFLANLSPAPTDPSRVEELNAARQQAADASKELQQYFYRHGIWLDPQTCDSIHSIIRLLNATTRGLQYHLFGWNLPDEMLEKISTQLDEGIPAARGLLDARFRSILQTGEPKPVVS